jgi:hemolysin-activating ACP:hemolysin acyltransferase
MGKSIMQDILKLYRKHKKYDNFNDNDLRLYLFPSLHLDQYRRHYLNDKLVGFTNWAYLSDQAQNKFKKTGLLNKQDWKSGNNLWHIETVCNTNLKDIMSWTKTFFANQFGIGKEISWLRIKDNKIIREVTVTTKESWL